MNTDRGARDRICGCLSLRRVALFMTLVTVCFVIGVGAASAAQVTLVWDANTEPELAGYKVYSGTVSGTYPTSVSVGNVTTYTVLNLTDGVVYYFAVTALDSFGNESGYSNEVAFSADIALVGNSATIAPGDTTPSTADHTDFGSADVTGGTVTRTFTIQNPGSGPLSLTGTPTVAVGGANAADFMVTAAPATSVAAAGSTTFTLQFDPGASGVRSATISIANSVATKSPYTFAIQGSGTTAPDIALTGNSVTIAPGDTTPATADGTDLGKTRVAGTLTQIFTIQNPGSGPLSLTGTPAVAVSGVNAADFTVTVPPAASVPAAGSTTFTLQFSPGANGNRNATISIASTVTAKSPYTFAVQGSGVAAPAAPRNVRATAQ